MTATFSPGLIWKYSSRPSANGVSPVVAVGVLPNVTNARDPAVVGSLSNRTTRVWPATALVVAADDVATVTFWVPFGRIGRSFIPLPQKGSGGFRPPFQSVAAINDRDNSNALRACR